MKLNQYTHIYLLGIGGIGMSALARYFLAHNKIVAGYDLTPSPLTLELEKEGAQIHFTDDIKLVDIEFLNTDSTLVIYTPAIPLGHNELNFFKENDYPLLKRSQVLGLISRDKFCIAIAGTHGKTTVSSMVAHIFNLGINGCNAFLGGIASNYNSNLILNENSNNLVVEADEFDRSFLQLSPNLAIITSMDADHLDIYDDHKGLQASFQEFIDRIQSNGKLLIKSGLEKNIKTELQVYTYSITHSKADFYIENLQLMNGIYHFDIHGPSLFIKHAQLQMPGLVNIENALAAAAISHLGGEQKEMIRHALSTFKGVKRRMEYIIKRDDLVYLDDYAHHPEELRASITSVKALYPSQKIIGIFQPHLFSRTRDFLDEFATSLALLDHLVLLDIYPAREQAIVGVSSQELLKKIIMKEKVLLKKEEVIPYLKGQEPQVILSLGAGDIDRLVSQIKTAFE